MPEWRCESCNKKLLDYEKRDGPGSRLTKVCERCGEVNTLDTGD